MSSDTTPEIKELAGSEYEWGFVTDIEQDTLPPGLDESVIGVISARKDEPEWLLKWRLKAYRRWTQMREEDARWAKVRFPPIDYQAISYYSAPKQGAKYESLDEVDPEHGLREVRAAARPPPRAWAASWRAAGNTPTCRSRSARSSRHRCRRGSR